MYSSEEMLYIFFNQGILDYNYFFLYIYRVTYE